VQCLPNVLFCINWSSWLVRVILFFLLIAMFSRVIVFFWYQVQWEQFIVCRSFTGFALIAVRTVQCLPELPFFVLIALTFINVYTISYDYFYILTVSSLHFVTLFLKIKLNWIELNKNSAVFSRVIGFCTNFIKNSAVVCYCFRQ